MDPLSFSASLIAILGLAATATQYLKDVKGGSEDRTRLREEIRNTVCLLEILNDRVEDVDSSEKDLVSIGSLNIPGGPLEQLKNALNQLVVKLTATSRLNRLTQALTWPLTKADVNAILSIIERQKGLFSLAMQNDNIGLSKGIKLQVVEVNQRITSLQISQENNQKRFFDQEGQDIVEWISPLKFWKNQNDVFTRRTEGTGGWLLESAKFQRWVDGTEKILWCPGIRAGKTVLASVVINHLQETYPFEDFGVAFIYCDYKERKEQSLVNLISSLLGQLVDKRVVISEELRNLYRQHKGKETRPSLPECLKLLQSVFTQFSTVFIVVDALDECWETDGTRSSFIGSLRQFLPKIRLLCTSRNLLDIEHEFEFSPRLEIRASNTDIKVYLETRIQQEPRLRKHIQADFTLLTSIIDAIITVADGMFLLAQLHIESIATKNNRKAIRSALASLPSALDETYEEVLQRIYCQNKDDISLAERVLSWISFSVRPLTVPELQHAIAIMDYKEGESIDDEDLPDEDILLAVCAGIVSIDGESNVIRLVHYTTQDFFERNRKRIFADAQESIAMACVSYLSQGPFREGPCIDFGSLRARFQRHPLLQYAPLNWGDHARGTPEKSCMEKILAFLDNECLTASASQAKKFNNPFINLPSFPRHIPSLVNASIIGLPEVVAFLLGRGSDIEESDDFGVCALIGAARHGHETVVRKLLAAGAQIESRNISKSTSLMEAASRGHENIVRLLLDEGADLEATDLRGRTALHRAAEKGHKAVIEILLSHGANVETEDLRKEKPLSLTVPLHIAAAELLVESASLNGKDAGLDLALHTLSCYSYGVSSLDLTLDFAKFLVHKGASLTYIPSHTIPNYPDYVSIPMLHNVAGLGDLKIVKLFIDCGANVIEKAGNGSTALHYASNSGRPEVVDLLIRSGAIIDAQTSTGQTSLHYAIESINGPSGSGKVAREIVSLLLKGGADVNKRDSNGETVLHQSAKRGYISTVVMLLENGADLKIKDYRNWTALQAAVACDQTVMVKQLLAISDLTEDPSLEILLKGAKLCQAATRGDEDGVQQLLRSGAVIVTDMNDETALHKAARRGYDNIVKMLLSTNIDINAIARPPLCLWNQQWANAGTFSLGPTALHLAAEKGHVRITRLLIERNVHVNVKDDDGYTPLSRASLCGHLDCVKFLLKHNADLTIKNMKYQTPLHIAVRFGREGIVRLLLAHGADFEAQSESGSSILNAAMEWQYPGIVKLLQEYGFKTKV